MFGNGPDTVIVIALTAYAAFSLPLFPDRKLPFGMPDGSRFRLPSRMASS